MMGVSTASASCKRRVKKSWDADLYVCEHNFAFESDDDDDDDVSCDEERCDPSSAMMGVCGWANYFEELRDK